MLCLPDSTQHWLLKAALNTDLLAGYEELMNWQNATDFQGHLDKSAIRLLPMIWQKYKVQLAGSPLKERFGGLYKKSFYNNSRLFHQLPQIVDVLEQGGFNYAFTKGVALHYFLYDDSGSRPMNDLDILIEQNDFIPAIKAFKQIGYYPAYPGYTLDMYLSGRIHAYSLRHDTLKDIDLHYYPTPLHNQQLTNQFFLENVRSYSLKGTTVRLLDPEKLALFLLVNYQFSDEWHWLVDVVLLQKKYNLSLNGLRPIVQQTGLYHSTYTQLNFLRNEFAIGSSDELNFYANQPRLLTDTCVLEARKLLDLNWRIALIAACNGLSNEKHMTLSLIYHIVRWNYQAFKRTPYHTLPRKSIKIFRDILLPHSITA